MSLLNFVGGLSAGYQGFRQGVKDVEDDEQRKADREYQAGQRQYQASQQQRTLDEQGRADALRDSLSKIPTTEEVEKPMATLVDDDGNTNPMVSTTAPMPRDKQLRKAADAVRASGDFGKAVDLESAADKLSLERSTRRFTELQASAGGMTTEQLAQAAAQIYNDDSLPGVIKNMKVGADGSVSVDFVHKETGQATPRTFKSKDEILSALQAYYDPANYASLVKMRAELAAKTAEALNDPSKRYIRAPAGLFDAKTGKIVDGTTPVNHEYIGDDSNGNPMYRKFDPAGRGAGAGAGKGSKAASSESLSLLKDALEKPGEKVPTPEAYARATDFLSSVEAQEPGIAPAKAVRIAIDAMTNPTRVTPKLNAATGSIDMVYQNPEVSGGKLYSLATGGTSAAELEKVIPGGKKALAESVAAMVASQPPENRAALVAAAFDPAKRQQLIASVSARYPNDATGQQERQRQIEIIQNKINLIAAYTSRPAPAAPTAPAAARPNLAAPVGGIAPASQYRPRTPAENAELVSRARAEKAARENRELEAAQAEARQLIEKKDVEGLYALQSSPRFGLLDANTKRIVSNLVNGR